ncbi:MAG: DUF5683 domain-containing protein [Porphyromonas sp.]|nr:DUF5683 domain-containing protein [Porphyromonas sp.]
MIRSRRIALSVLLLSGWFALNSFAQEVGRDSLSISEMTPLIEEASNQEAPELTLRKSDNGSEHRFIPDPKTAVLLSIIPGGGQVYNRVYWKLPILVGAYTACYYAISWNNNNLLEYSNAYREIKSDTPMDFDSWKNFVPYGVDPETYVNNTGFHEQLKRGRDFYRRNRDLSIIVTVGVYALFIIDAYVDAELYNFDISPNLTLSYAPAYIPATPETPDSGIGVQLALTF